MRILAVDDDPVILELLEEVLSASGYDNVVTVGSAIDALHAVENSVHAFDCILLDIQMPHMDGVEACDRLRKLPRYRDTPILMLTAMSEKRYIDSAFHAGATDYITKPFDMTELNARLRVAQTISDRRKPVSNKVFSAKALHEKSDLTVEEACTIQDVDGVIPLLAMHNYLAQLGRSSLFGSSVIAFKVNDIDRLFNAMTSYEYTCMITDVAEAIASSLPFVQSLCSYSGNGVFICVAAGGHSVAPDMTLARVVQSLEDMELCYNDGRPMLVNLSISDAVRLSFRTGQGTKRAIIQAVSSVEMNPAADTASTRTQSGSNRAADRLVG